MSPVRSLLENFFCQVIYACPLQFRVGGNELPVKLPNHLVFGVSLTLSFLIGGLYALFRLLDEKDYPLTILYPMPDNSW